jgi:hypothetical protein
MQDVKAILKDLADAEPYKPTKSCSWSGRESCPNSCSPWVCYAWFCLQEGSING